MSTEEIRLISKQLNELQARVEALERPHRTTEGAKNAAAQNKETIGSSTSAQNPSMEAHLRGFQELKQREQDRSKSRGKDTSHQPNQPQAGKMLGAVAVVCFILASIFFVKLAIDAGWLTPIRQLGCLTVFGVGLIAAGYHLKNSDVQFAALLPGAGAVVLFVAAFSGHLYFQAYSSTFAAVLVSAVSLLTLYLFRDFKNDFYLVSAALGTYAVPLLLRSGLDDFFSVTFYYFVWDIMFCVAAIWLRQRSIVSLVAYLALLSYAFIFQIETDLPEIRLSIALIQLVQFLIFAVSIGVFSVAHKERLSARQAWALFPVAVLFYGLEYAVINSIDFSTAPLIALGFGVLVFGIYRLGKGWLGDNSLESSPMIATYLTIIAVHTIYYELVAEAYGGWVAVALMAALLACAKKLRYERFWPAYLVAAHIPAIEYFKVLGFGIYSNSEMIIIGGIFAAFCFFAYRLAQSSSSAAVAALILGEIQLGGILYRIADAMIEEPASRFLTTGLWASAALILLNIASISRDATLARSAVGIFGIVSVKLLLFDLPDSGGIARVIALLVIGALLYAGGLLLRKINAWDVNKSAAPG